MSFAIRTEKADRAEDIAFHRYLRTGRRSAPLELKFNPNHDPDTGRFTFTEGGSSGGGGRSSPRRPGPARAPAPRPAEGPFRSAAGRQDAVGEMARSANAFVQRRTDTLKVPLGGIVGTVTVTRAAGDVVNLDNRFFAARGRLHVTPGREEIVLAMEPPTGKLGVRFQSFPSHLRLFQAVTGRINYSIDRDLRYTWMFDRTGRDPIRKGTYLGPDGKGR